MNQHFASGFVRVGNRSDKDITVTYDGRSCVVPANGTAFMSPAAAQKAIFQARIMGTENPYNPEQFESYLWVEGWNLPTDKVKYDQSKQECLDRKQLPPDRQKVTSVQHTGVRPELAGAGMGAGEGGGVVFANPAGTK
jgi:hypothetical protein